MESATPRITRVSASLNEPIRVTAELEDGSSPELFAYYSDELRFDEDELIGLTVEEAQALHHRRDVGYLQS